MNYFIFDITQRVFGNAPQFGKILENYPSNSFILVTLEQKRLIIGLSDSKEFSIRFIDMQDCDVRNGAGLREDVMVCDTFSGNYKIITARELNRELNMEEKK
jgi:hypothetical protein